MFSFFSKYGRKVAATVCFVTMLTISVSAAPSIFGELADRSEGSPLQAFSILLQSLENGVTSVDVQAQTERNWWWTDSFEETATDVIEESFSVRLYANDQNQEVALILELQDDWMSFDVSAFVNTERIAAGSSLFGGSNIGFYFATFEQDLIALLNGLYRLDIIPELPSSSDLEMVIDFVHMYQELLSAGVELNPLDVAAILFTAARHINQTTEQVTVGNESVTRVEFSIEMHDFYNLMLNATDRLSNIHDNILDFMLDGMRHNIATHQAGLEYGRIALALYTNIAGRLVQASFEISQTATTTNWRGDPVDDSFHYSVVANFGADATDVWTFELIIIDNWGHDIILIEWEILEHGRNVIEHVLTATHYDQNIYHAEPEFFAVGFRWHRYSSELVFFYEYDDRWGAGSGSYTAYFSMGGDYFTLRLTDLVDWNTTYNIEISATVGVPVPTVEFTNISQVDELVAIFEEMFFINDFVTQFSTHSVETVISMELPAITHINRGSAVVANCYALNLRRGPGTGYDAFNHLLVGDVVTILEYRGNWFRVDSHRGIGWVYGAFLSHV